MWGRAGAVQDLLGPVAPCQPLARHENPRMIENDGGDDAAAVEVAAWFADLVPEFLANRGRDVDRLLAALARRDFVAISRLAHNLKGVAGGYRFLALCQVGAALEEAAAAEDEAAIRAGVERLATYLRRVRVVAVP